MLTKLLFTLAVIAALLTWARQRRSPMAGDNAEQRQRWPTVFLAAAAVLIVFSAAAATYYDHWRQANAIVKVRVINSNTGQMAVYEARRKDIDSRVFVTTDRREIRVSDIERLELVESP